MSILANEALATLFRQARSYDPDWDKPVTDDTLRHSRTVLKSGKRTPLMRVSKWE